MSGARTGTHPVIPRIVHSFAVPILLGWIALAVLLTVGMPSLDKVDAAQSVSLSPADAPSTQAMKHIGRVFQESDSGRSAMMVLEGDQPLGDETHRIITELVDMFKADFKHVTHVQDFWGDPLTAGARKAVTARPPTSSCISQTIKVSQRQSARGLCPCCSLDQLCRGMEVPAPEMPQIYIGNRKKWRFK